MQGRRWPGGFQLTVLPAFAGQCAPYLTVKFMALEVSLAVPPPPYGPPEPGVPGLVTVTGTVPGVAMAVAGIAAISCFPVT